MKNQQVTVFQSKVYNIRGQQVMLDRDVAEVLGVDAKHLNENAATSPKWDFLRAKGSESEYRFQISDDELSHLRSEFPTANVSRKSRVCPFVYTRKGCAYFGTSMNSPEACEQAVNLVEVFDKVHSIMDRYALANPDFALRRHQAIMDAAKFLNTLPGYSKAAVASYVEQSTKDIQGVGITTRTLLDVQAYLVEKGMTTSEARKVRAQFGKVLRAAYISKFGKEPEKYRRLVEGAQRLINSYTEAHRDLFDQVWNLMKLSLLETSKNEATDG